MVPVSFLCFLSLLSLVTFVPINLIAAEAGSRNHFSSSTLEFPKRRAEKFIRELNLFPRLDVNIVEEDPAVTAPKIVEKAFQFPNFGTKDANGTTIQDLGHHAGYYGLTHTKSARMFYYFFESRNNRSSDPVVIWLTGGPGCSGSLALFYENGPFHLTNNLSLVWNNFGWDTVSNLIYVDQPIGTGFSYSSSGDDIRSSSEEAAEDLYDFLQAFFEKHPEYAKNDFYITGESYAGHYIPAFAALIHQKNKNKEGLSINLKGLAIGNGMTNPEIQYMAYPDFALQMKLINKSEHDKLSKAANDCQQGIKNCVGTNNTLTCTLASMACQSIFGEIVQSVDGLNYYDIRKKCQGDLCYDFSKVEDFLNEKSVKQALGVGDILFVSCSSGVADAMERDWVTNSEAVIPELLQDGIKLLIYAGEYDLICNWLGNSRWLDATEWNGQKDYLSAPSTEFIVDNAKAGLQKSYGPLTFLKVYNAGHLVPMDQPKASLEMLTRWIQGKPL